MTKLDRLGRDVIDVSITIRMLGKLGVRNFCFAFGGPILPAGCTMTLNVLSAVAQLEHDLLIERI